MNTEVPEGWTDDMTISIRNGQSHEQVANWLLSSFESGKRFESVLEELVEKFGVSESDADLALDRARGGIVRAVTGNPNNAPSREKDPIAFHTFEAAWQTFPRSGFFRQKRKPGGKWLEWYESS